MKNKLFFPILIMLLVLPLISSKTIEKRQGIITPHVKLIVTKSSAPANLGMNNRMAEPSSQDIAKKDSNADVYYNLGISHENEGRYKEAVEAYIEAIRIKPDYTEAHYHLGLSYSMINDRTSALNEYKILKNIDPDMADDLYEEITEITSSDKDNRFVVQVGAYKFTDNADEILEKLKTDYLNAYLEKGNDFNMVRIHGIKTKKDGAQIMKEIFRKYNLKPFLRNAR